MNYLSGASANPTVNRAINRQDKYFPMNGHALNGAPFFSPCKA
jgi:hypothetical protein